jgi:hypothetical protein
MLAPDYDDVELSLHLVRDGAQTGNTSAVWTIHEEGLYDLIFTNCRPTGGSPDTTMRAVITMANPGPTFLTAGSTPLPPLYGTFSILYAVLLVVWLMRLRSTPSKVNRVHILMAALLAFKTLALLFKGVMFHFMATTGHSTGWSIVWYILNFFRAMLFFTTILAVGTGYALLKPFLHSREKKIIMVVLTLQVLNNVAIIISYEGEPGTVQYGTWVDLLHIFDIICCCFVLFPIAWSLKQLQAAAGADEKAAQVLARVKQFRSFYLYCIVYIYLTRIVVFILESTLSFRIIWLAALLEAVITITFYTAVGWKFRPEADNIYLQVPTDDDGEFGLGEDDVAADAVSTAPPRGAHTPGVTAVAQVVLGDSDDEGGVELPPTRGGRGGKGGLED